MAPKQQPSKFILPVIRVISKNYWRLPFIFVTNISVIYCDCCIHWHVCDTGPPYNAYMDRNNGLRVKAQCENNFYPHCSSLTVSILQSFPWRSCMQCLALPWHANIQIHAFPPPPAFLSFPFLLPFLLDSYPSSHENSRHYKLSKIRSSFIHQTHEALPLTW